MSLAWNRTPIMSNEELEELYMRSNVVSIASHDHFADYENAEYFVMPETPDERNMADTWRSFQKFMGGVAITAVLSLIFWGLGWAGLSGYRYMNAVTGWLIKAVGL